MDFYKDFPERSDAGTATTPDGGIVAGNDKLNDNDYALVGANSTGSNSQGKGYKVKFSSIYNYLKGKLLGDQRMIVSKDTNGFVTTDQFRTFPMAAPTGSTSTNKVFVVLQNKSAAFVGKMGFIGFHRSCIFDISALVTGGSSSTAQSVIIANVTGNINIIHVKFFKRADVLIIELEVSAGGNYANGFALSYVSADIKVSLDTSYTYNPSTDLDLKTATLQTQSLASSYIAERYSINEEQALTRRMIANDPTVVEQFEAYNAYCEECKAKAKEELANQPQVLPADELNNQTI